MEDRKKNKSENKKEQPSKEAIKKLDKNAQRLKAEALRGNADDRIASKTKNDDVADKSWSQAAFVNNLSPNTEVEVEVDTVVSKEQINTPVAGNETNLTQEPQPLVGKIIPTTGEPDVTYSIAENHVSSFGVFRLAPTGAFTFIPSVNSLAGQSQQFTIHATHKGEVHQQQLTITQGHNQIAKVTISGADNAILIEDHNVQAGELHATGNLNIAATAPTDTRVVVETLSGQYGTLEIDANGHWEYSVNNGQQAVQALKSTTTLHESFTIHLVNGDSHQISITIKGDEDKAIISGVDSQPLTEDQHIDTAHHLNAQGKLDIIDVDQGDAYFHAQTAMGKYGEFTIDEQGHWHYSVDDTLQSIQSLASGEKITDTVHVLSKDGATTHDVVVSITGTNDAPVLTVTPNAANLVTGKLTETDVDTTDTHTFSTTQSIGLYGHLSIDPSTGDYTYTQTPGTVKGMSYNHNTGQYTGHDVFEVQVTDGHGGTDTKYITFDVSATVAGPTVTTPNAPVTIILGAPTPPTITLTTPSTTPLILTAPPTASLTIDLASTSDTYGGTGTNSDDITSVTTPMITGHVDIPFSTVNIFDGTTKVGTVIADDKGDYAVATSVLGGTEAGQLHHLHAEATAPGVAGATPILSPTLDVTIDTGATTVADTGTATEDQTAGVASIGNVLGNDESGMVVKAGDLQGAFGTVHMHADGTYTYDLNNQHPSIQALPDGQTTTDIYTYEVTDVAGNTSTETLEITITGTNDNPVVSSAIVDGGHGTDTILRNLPASLVKGQLTATDIDTGDKLSWELMPSSTHSDPHYGDYGHIALAPSGQWVYRVGSAAATALEEGEQVTETFHLKVSDGHGGSTIQTLIIHVTGINNAPIVVTHSQGGLPIAEQTTTQDSSFTFTLPPGTFNDVDHGDHLTLSATGLPSWLHFDATTGTFSGTPTNSDVAGKLPITVTATDTHGAHVEASFALTVNNINDAPVISPISIVTVTEDGAHAAGQLQATDPDVGDAQHLTYSIANAVDGFRLNSDGTWDFDPSHAAYQHIAAGISETVSIPVTVSDGHGGTDTQQLVINITGTNDVPVISGVDSGSVQEESQLTASGTLTISDADAGEDHFIAVSGTTGSGNHGTLDIDASGAWTYHLDNSNAEVQALGESPSGTTNSLTDTFTVTSTDGTAHTITVTVNGTNDAPVFTTATLTQSGDEDASVTGQLGSTDTDIGDSATYAATGTLPAGFTLQADGRYTLDASVQAYQHLEAGHSQDITIPVTVTDGAGGTATQTLTITITGTNDAPVITDISAKTVAEGSTVSGTITSSDVDDHATATFSIAQPVDGFSLNADGSYSFDANHASYAHLAAGSSQDVTIPVTVTDDQGASSTQDLVIHVTGTNDAPVIAGTDTGTAQEESQQTASGTLTIRDADAGEAHFTAASGITGTGNHGQLDIDASGAWTYHLDNSNAEVQALGESPSGTTNSLTDTFTVTSADGTAHTITVTVNGTNDAPVFTTATLTQSGDEDTSVTGQLGSTDTDIGDSATYAATGTLPAGFTLQADGRYTLDASVQAYQHLEAGHSQDITIPVTVTDGAGGTATQTLTITITGTNDAPVITDISAKTVAEGSTVSGIITSSDVDDHATATFSIAQPVDGFSLHADGSYTFDANHASYAHLAAGSSQDVTIPVTVTDDQGASSTQDLIIHVTGTNDAPVIAGTDHGSITEDQNVFSNPKDPSIHELKIQGHLDITDIDSGEDHFVFQRPILGDNGFGTFFITQQGHWGYSANNDDPKLQELGVTDTRTDSIDVKAADGTTHKIIVTIHGTNDDPTFTSATLVNHGNEDTKVTGQLGSTDIDTGDSATYAATGTLPAGFTLQADGRYTLDASVQAYQHIAAGDTQVVTVPVTVTDGAGGTATQTLTITITGTNDAPVITNISAKTVAEGSTVSGTITSSDVDDHATATFSIAQPVDGFSLHADGSYSFDANHASYAHLAAGSSQDVTIPVTVTDDQGASSTQDLVIHVTGTNDVPTVTHTVVAQSATEDTAFSFALSSDTFNDIDNGDHLTLSATGLPNWLHFDAATGTFSGTPTNADVGKLPITVTATDSHGAQVSTSFVLTVNNTNDAPVLTPLSTVAVTEDGAHASGQLQSTDPDVGDAQHLTYSVANAVDGFTLNNDGTWDFDPSHAAYQHIAAGISETVSIPVMVSDGHGGTDTQQLVINITGTNDNPVVSSTMVDGGHGFDEDTGLTSLSLVRGQLTATDVDTGDALKWEIISTHSAPNIGEYGHIALSPSGQWVYRIGSTDATALSEGEQATETFHFKVSDGHGGSTTQTLTIHITGVNNAPTVVSHSQGVLPIAEQTTNQDSPFTFTLPADTFIDVDHGDHLTLSATGMPSWLHFDAATGTFSGTPTNSDVAGKLPITVTATDSYGAHVEASFALTVNNINDAPIISPISIVTVTEDGAHASGQLQATDPDVGDAQHLMYSVANAVDGFTLNNDGTWDFDPSHAAYQHIAAGASETISIPITVSDGYGGTDTQQLVINITGTNDAPVISGTEHGSITEDQHVTPNATDPSIHELTIQGRLAVTDVDSNEAHFQDQTGVVGDNGFGDFSITPSGFWIYTANNDDPKIQELGANDSHTDSITVTTVDGTSHKIVVTIHGANDAPTLTHTVVSQTATEDTAFSFALPSDTFNDIDNGDHLTLSATGLPSWLHFDAATSTFSGTPSNADVGKLPITVTATDSHGAQVSTSFALTVNNTNDAPTLTHTVVSQTATEDTAFSFALPLDTFKDVDNGDHLTLSATGLPSWLHFDAATSTFSGTPTNADVGKLPITVIATDSHGAQVSTSFALTVNNTNDAPVLTPISTVAVTEDGAHASGQLQATDPDVGDAQHLTYSVANAVDGFTLNSDGTWDFDPSHAAYQHIAAGASEMVSIPITVSDGHGGTDTQQLVIDITGTNDAPVIAPGGVIENTLLARLHGSTLIQGQLVATDIDTNDQPKWEIVNPTGSLNPGKSTYGTFIISDDGRWFFRGGGSGGIARSLAEHETVDLPFTVQASDGHGGVVQQVVTVHVVGTNDAPTITHTVTAQSATEDTAFSFALPSDTFNDLDNGDHLTLSATGLPSWLHFDAATGTFSGTPSNADVGKLPITVTATDSQGARVSTSFALTVDNTNDAPTLTITQTTHITGTLVGSDVDVGDVLTYSSPNGVVDSTAHTTVVHGQFGDLTIDTVSGAYTYAPHSSAVGMAFDPATGIYSGHEVFEVVVTDSSGAAMSQFIQFDPTATVTAATTSGNPPVVAAQVQTPPTVTDAMPTLPTITPPTNAVTISLDPASNSGDKTDLITSDTTPTITGHTDIPFSVVEIKDGTTVVATTTSDVNGDYSVTTSALSGSNSGDAHSLTATATAPSAATGIDSSGMVVTVDTGITVPTVDLVDASDSGSNHSDNLTSDTTPTFTLTGIDSDVTQVEVFDGSTSLGMATKVSGSTWTLTTDAAHELTANGHHDITAVVTDTQGNSVTSSPLTISLDTDRPMPPLMFDQITSDNVINAAESTGTVAVTGRVGGVLGQDFVSGDLMTIHLGGKDYQGSVDSSGAFSIDIPGSELAANHAYSASFAAHDNAGNASGVNRLSTSYAVDTDATTASDTDTATEDQAAGVTHGNVLTNDEQGLTVTNAGDKIGTYGTLHLQADGSYTFDLNNLNPAVQAIPTGQTVTDSYTYEVTDAAGNTAQQILTITITGTNDIPVFTAIPSISVTEDAAMVTGHLQANDFDTGANQHLTYTASQAVDGFTLNSDGSWSFDPSHASYQHLAKGVSETISIPVSVTDGEGGTSHSTLTIDITGTNDHPYLLGTDSYTLDESDNIASGQLHALDADDGDTVTLSLDPAQPQVAGFTFDPTDGSYTFDPSDPAYNYLAAGEKLDIVIPITCTDSSGESRTQTHAITFHLTGTNDAAIITGTDSGSITEDLNINAAAVSNTLSAHGHLDVADADTGEAHFQSQIDIKGDHGFGSFMILDQGEWMYIADNDNPEIQKLSAGETRTDSVTVHSADGTPHKITVTIHGADESGVPTVVHESAQGGVHLASTVDATQPVEHIMALADFGLTSTDKGTTITLVTAPAHDGSNKDDGGQFVLQDAQGHETPIHDKGSFTYDDVLAGRVIYQQFDLKSHDVKYTISGDPREHELAFTPPSSTSHDVPDTTETSSFTATLDSTDAPADHPASSHEGISDAASLYMDLLQPKHHVTEDKHTLNDHSQPQHLVVENVDDSMVHNPQHNADEAHGHVNTPVDSYLKMVGANHADKAEVKAEHDASLLDQKFDHNPLADHVHDVLAHEGLDHFANPLADEAHDKHDKHAVFDDHGGKGMEHGMDSPQVDDQLIDGNHHSPDQYNH